jgi:SAM-dependent methyltransferase
MNDPTHWKAEQARAWGSAPWQNIAEGVLSVVHDELVARLAPHPGDRWLDVATGTGAVALRAARAGTEVSALDLSPALVRTARRLAAEQGLAIRFTVGDAERLPYPDSSLGLTYWRPNSELERLMDRVGYARPPDADNPREWRQPRYVNRLLSADFELEYVEATCLWTAESGESAWRLFTDSDGPAKTGVAALSPVERQALRRGWVDYFERHRQDGAVSVPRPYLLILGRRRGGGRR